MQNVQPFSWMRWSGAIALLFPLASCAGLQSQTEVPSPTPSAAAPVIITPTPTPTPTVSAAELWQQAQSRASDAEKLAQSAQSRDDWGLVTARWQQAIALIQRLPRTSPEYTQAQQQLASYQRNLADARQRANSITPQVDSFSATPSPTPSPGTSPGATPTPAAGTPGTAAPGTATPGTATPGIGTPSPTPAPTTPTASPTPTPVP